MDSSRHTNEVQGAARIGESSTWLAVLGAGLSLVVGLTIAGVNNRQSLNADAIAYMRIAEYYALWKTDLMVSGYWGPLLSWMMVPFLKLGVAPLDAARCAMGGSAAVFWAASLFLWRQLNLPSAGIKLGAWLSACAAVIWSVDFITPDLLAAGLISAAIAWMASGKWLGGWQGPAMSGLFWALAYYAKAVALPLALAVSLSLALLRWRTASGEWRSVGRALGLTLLVFSLMVAPCVIVLSLKYERFTFSTSARIAHAWVGPDNPDRAHLIGTMFHRPDPGRITAWEDPSRMDYRYWSPFESRAHFNHQLEVIKRNAKTVGRLLGRFDALWLGVIALCVAVIPGPGWRQKLASERWRWGFVPVAWLMAIHLPVRVESTDQRYFLMAWPFLLAATLGLTLVLTVRLARRSPVLRWLVLALVTVSFARPVIEGATTALLGNGDPASVVAQDLAGRMRRAGLQGSIAGSATFAGVKTGLYVAFLLDTPWYGDGLHPTAESIRISSARFYIVRRDSPLADELKRAAGLRDLDALLLPDGDMRATYPLQVFEILPR